METKYCSHCGKKIEKDAKFCVYCGEAQEGASENVTSSLEELGKGVSDSVQDLTQKVQTSESVQKGVSGLKSGWLYLLEKLKRPTNNVENMPRAYPFVIMLIVAFMPIFSLGEWLDYLDAKKILALAIFILLCHGIALVVSYLVIKLLVNKTVSLSVLFKEYTSYLTPLAVVLTVITILNLFFNTVQLPILAILLMNILSTVAVISLVHYNYPTGEAKVFPFYYVNVINFIAIGLIFLFIFVLIGEVVVQEVIDYLFANPYLYPYLYGW